MTDVFRVTFADDEGYHCHPVEAENVNDAYAQFEADDRKILHVGLASPADAAAFRKRQAENG